MAEQRAGRRLDRAVGRRVMGCHVRENSKGCYDLVVPGSYNRVDYVGRDGAWSGMPAFSTEIAAAWTLVERLHALGWVVEVTMDNGTGRYCRAWYMGDDGRPVEHESRDAATIPLAICRAALVCVEARAG